MLVRMHINRLQEDICGWRGGEMMFYYKIISDDNIIESLEERSTPSTDPIMIQITENEYVTLMNDFEKQCAIESDANTLIEKSKDDYIAELEAENANLKSTNETLEAENAALLFQTLTGEEYTA